MGYIAENLGTDETVLVVANVHWFVYLPGSVFLFLGMAIVFHPQLQPFGILLILAGLYLLLIGFLCRFGTELAVTNRRLIAKRGVIWRRTVELSLRKVETIVVDQSVLGRLLNYGNVIVHGAGSGTRFAAIVAPIEFRREVTEIVDRAQAARDYHRG